MTAGSLRAVFRIIVETDRQRCYRLRANNSAFHLAIARIAGSPLLELMLQSILELLDVSIHDRNNPRSISRTPSRVMTPSSKQ